MSETTTEQLAEIEGQAADTPATEYTPPEGWRVLAVGERLQPGDLWVNYQGESRPTRRVGETVNDERYIRPIESQPQPEPVPEPQPQPVQVCEGRWRTRGGEVKNIRPCKPLRGPYFVWPWTDGFMTFQDNGRHLLAVSDNDLVEYLGPIESQPEPVPEPNAATIEELRSEVSYVQNLLGTERRRVAELEELVSSLRTINAAQEKTVRLAGQENTDLKHRLDVVSAEWAEQAGTINGLRAHVEAVEADVVQQRLERNRYQNQVLRLTAELDSKTTECRNLQIELDALQQAPQAVNDRFEEGWDAGTARAVETIAEWTETFRTCGSQGLSYHVMQNLPHIMRTLTGLTQED